MDKLHPSHQTRESDASSFDEICMKCGATDITGGGWGELRYPCGESNKPIEEQSIVYRLNERARIRRQAKRRKSVKEGKPDRISDLLEEAAEKIEELTDKE